MSSYDDRCTVCPILEVVHFRRFVLLPGTYDGTWEGRMSVLARGRRRVNGKFAGEVTTTAVSHGSGISSDIVLSEIPPTTAIFLKEMANRS